MKKNFKVKVNDSLVYELNSIDSNNLDYLELSESNYHVLLNKKSFSLKIDKANFLTKEYTVSVNSNSYNVKIEYPSWRRPEYFITALSFITMVLLLSAASIRKRRKEKRKMRKTNK